MSKPIQYFVLSEARLLIDNPQDWCKGTFAVGKSGRSLVSGSPRAVRHCAVSAIMLAARQHVPKKRDAERLADTIMAMMAMRQNARDIQLLTEEQPKPEKIEDLKKRCADVILID